MNTQTLNLFNCIVQGGMKPRTSSCRHLYRQLGELGNSNILHSDTYQAYKASPQI